MTFSKSRLVVDVDGTEVDADDESLDGEKLEDISSGELLDQEIIQAKLEEIRKVEDLREIEDFGQFSCT